MTEKELISKLKELRQIQPQSDWVFLLKNRVLSSELTQKDKFYIGLQNWSKLVFGRGLAPILAVMVLLVFFGFSLAQSAVPGEFLYNIKKITEKSRAMFVSEEEMPEFSLELAHKRLAELNKIVEKNQTKNLKPAINEVQTSITKIAETLLTLQATSSDSAVINKFVEETNEIQNKIQTFKEQGIVIDDQNLEKVSQELKCKLLSVLLADLEKRTLTEEQEEKANQIKEIADEGKCQESLELFLIEFNQKTSQSGKNEQKENELENN